ncbi:hypothetical protein K490DRAFT_69017 [Saccharata proteae CBS 121410]|uniref:Uncharacterized protein n=1 Tax=Saccharata proteae CBS 121410 TaxID=1314787 RepID=A0A9P4HMA2_9PEZI|nr:hypothetical protein K490DRAFT_69017 [Saccharata proteae CBS 121410]
MPSIFPKTFARRKSSANALEEFEKPTESTFRVIPRNDSSKSPITDISQRPRASRPISSPNQHGRQQSFDDELGPSNRGSNGSSTANSGVSRFYDTSSSARLSSSSTLPSAADVEDDLFSKKVPVPTLTEGRTSSFTSITGRFGFKKAPKGSASPPKLDMVTDENQDPRNARAFTRERAMTASSYASTAHPLPPKLDDISSSDFGGGLGDIFSNIGQRRSAYMQDANIPPPLHPGTIRSETEPAFPPPAKTLGSSRPNVPPMPVDVAPSRDRDAGGSPYSWDSRRSNDALIKSPTETIVSPVSEKGPPVPPHMDRLSMNPPAQSTITQVIPPEQKAGTNGAKRVVGQQRVEDADARMVRESFRASRDARDLKTQRTRENQQSVSDPISSDVSLKTQTASSAGSSRQHDEIKDITPQTPAHDDEEEPLFGHSAPVAAASNVRWAQQKQPQRMTQAEFAHARHQQSREPSEDDSEPDEEYMDEDAEEEERRKLEEVRRMRLQQSAKMSNWRETMKKTTGGVGNQFGRQQRSSSVERPKFRTSVSSSDLLLHKSTGSQLALDEEAEDDTEDIPLGILSAHGFPKMQRLSNASSLGNIRSSSTPGVRTSSIASNAGGARSTLPPFARGLPADLPAYTEPYYGASIHNQAPRESLGFGNLSGPGSAYGGSNAGTEQPTLVNMIADREKADQARRGGATKIMNNYYGQPTHGQRIPSFIEQQQRREAPVGFPHHVPMPNRLNFQPPPMGQPQFAMPPDQMQLFNMLMAQAQAQNQQIAMQQAMMQQQMMQQPMMQPPQMGLPQMSPQPNFMGAGPMQRPTSMAGSTLGMGQRTRSMINPSSQNMLGIPQQQLHPGGSYTASIAPSERNNVGASARYRSVVQQNDGSSTVVSSSTLQPPPTSTTAGQRQKIPVRVKAKQNDKPPRGGSNEEEDEEGWGAPTPKKTSKWSAGKKSNDDLNEMIPSFE